MFLRYYERHRLYHHPDVTSGVQRVIPRQWRGILSIIDRKSRYGVTKTSLGIALSAAQCASRVSPI